MPLSCLIAINDHNYVLHPDAEDDHMEEKVRKEGEKAPKVNGVKVGEVEGLTKVNGVKMEVGKEKMEEVLPHSTTHSSGSGSSSALDDTRSLTDEPIEPIISQFTENGETGKEKVLARPTTISWDPVSFTLHKCIAFMFYVQIAYDAWFHGDRASCWEASMQHQCLGGSLRMGLHPLVLLTSTWRGIWRNCPLAEERLPFGTLGRDAISSFTMVIYHTTRLIYASL